MSKRLLLIESDKNVQSCSKMLFQHYGFDVDTAQTLPQAKEAVVKTNYPVVVTELCFEDRDESEGLEIIEFIKKNSPDTKIIVVTYLCDNAVKKKVHNLGILGYYEKPVSFDKILRLIPKS